MFYSATFVFRMLRKNQLVSTRKFLHDEMEPRKAVQPKCIIYLKGWARISVVFIKLQQMFLIKCVLSILFLLFLMYTIIKFWDLFMQRRRDRINEKMRALQELIPNCNKVDLCLISRLCFGTLWKVFNIVVCWLSLRIEASIEYIMVCLIWWNVKCYYQIIGASCRAVKKVILSFLNVLLDFFPSMLEFELLFNN